VWRGARFRFRFRRLREDDRWLARELPYTPRRFAIRLRGIGALEPHCITNNRAAHDQLPNLVHFKFFPLNFLSRCVTR
jgi:hypothetical protein